MIREETPGGTPTGTDERRYGFKKALEKVKDAVPVIDEADLLCGPLGNRGGLRKMGEEWWGICPLPDHTGKGEDGRERTPSFAVNGEKNLWYCHGCNRGGDVIELHQLAHSLPTKWDVLESLATSRGIDVDGERSKRWSEAWDRKNAYTEAAYEVLGEVLARRLFRTLILPFIDLTEDPAQHDEDLERAWGLWMKSRRWSHDARAVVRGDEGYLRTIGQLRVEAEVLAEVDGG